MFQKILVIDDTPAMAQLAESVLARQYPGASVDVLFAQRGLDAFARMQVAQPDLILLSANPLDDIRHTRRIELVLRGGRLCRPDELLRLAPKE